MGKFRNRHKVLGFRFSTKDLHYDHKGYVYGLLLVTQFNVAHGSINLVVLNPSIRKLKLLPPFPPRPPGRAEIVLGYDPLCNDHKVVVIFFPFCVPEDEYPGSIAVYEFSTGCWRVTSGIEVPDQWYLAGPKVFTKGIMHWLSFDMSITIEQKKRPMIDTHFVSFDFASETFSCTELPGDRGDDSSEKVTIPYCLGDSLALFDISSTRTCVWVLRKCGHSGTNLWSKWHDTASDSVIFRVFHEHRYHINNFLYAENIKKFLLDVNRRVQSYDMENNKMKDVETCYCSR